MVAFALSFERLTHIVLRIGIAGVATILRPAPPDQREPPPAAADYPRGQQEGRGGPRPEQVPSEHGGGAADSTLVQRALHRDECAHRSERDGSIRDVCARGASEEGAQAEEELVYDSLAALQQHDRQSVAHPSIRHDPTGGGGRSDSRTPEMPV